MGFSSVQTVLSVSIVHRISVPPIPEETRLVVRNSSQCFLLVHCIKDGLMSEKCPPKELLFFLFVAHVLSVREQDQSTVGCPAMHENRTHSLSMPV